MKNILYILLIALCSNAFGQIQPIVIQDNLHLDVGKSSDLNIISIHGNFVNLYVSDITGNFQTDVGIITVFPGVNILTIEHTGTTSEIGSITLKTEPPGDIIYVKTVELIAGDPFGPPFTIDLGTDKVLCYGESVELIAPPGHKTYEWNTGETSQSITVNSGGIYDVKVWNFAGVLATDEITVQALPKLEPAINISIIVNPGIFYLLDGGNYSAHLWSTGETTRSIDVSEDGEYSVAVTDENGCTGHAKIAVTIPPEVDCGSVTPISPIAANATCSDFPLVTRRWKLTNPNSTVVRLDWIIEGTIQKSWLDVPPGDSFLSTLNVLNKNHKIIVNWHDGSGKLQSASAITAASKCTNIPTSTSTSSRSTNVYPNPGGDQITLEISHGREELSTLQIFTLSGAPKRTQQIQLSPGTNFIMQNISDLERGVYIMKVNGELIRFTKE